VVGDGKRGDDEGRGFRFPFAVGPAGPFPQGGHWGDWGEGLGGEEDVELILGPGQGHEGALDPLVLRNSVGVVREVVGEGKDFPPLRPLQLEAGADGVEFPFVLPLEVPVQQVSLQAALAQAVDHRFRDRPQVKFLDRHRDDGVDFGEAGGAEALFQHVDQVEVAGVLVEDHGAGGAWAGRNLVVVEGGEVEGAELVQQGDDGPVAAVVVAQGDFLLGRGGGPLGGEPARPLVKLLPGVPGQHVVPDAGQQVLAKGDVLLGHVLGLVDDQVVDAAGGQGVGFQGLQGLGFGLVKAPAPGVDPVGPEDGGGELVEGAAEDAGCAFVRVVALAGQGLAALGFQPGQELLFRRHVEHQDEDLVAGVVFF